MKLLVYMLWLCILFPLKGSTQVLLSTNYFTDFGTSDITTWTNNSTVPGWYSQATWRGHQNVTTSSPSNSGGFYTYECNGNNNQKIGGRASGSANPVYYGLRLRNTSGSTIQYLEIGFDWFQFSLAQNGGNVNTVSVHYQVGATVTSLTAGSWTAVPALNFSAPMSSSVAGSNQINGYPCTQSGAVSTCLAVNIANNQEIMIRWRDPDDGSNDPHLGIDNVFVGISTDPSCFTILPTALTTFEGTAQSFNHLISWSSATEVNLERYVLESATNGKAFYPIHEQLARGTTNSGANYQFSQPVGGQNDIVYYRLRMIDFDGSQTFSDIIALESQKDQVVQFYGENIFLEGIGTGDQDYEVNIYDAMGKLCYTGIHRNGSLIPWQQRGLYFIDITGAGIRQRIYCP